MQSVHRKCTVRLRNDKALRELLVGRKFLVKGKSISSSHCHTFLRLRCYQASSLTTDLSDFKFLFVYYIFASSANKQRLILGEIR